MRRIDYFDVVAKTTADLDRTALARAVEAMSKAYRLGRPAPHARSRFHRAAYLVHLVPALVCDQRNLFLGPLSDLLDRPELDVLVLGGGPGTEVLALAEAVARIRAERDLALTHLRVTRVDILPSWDEVFLPLRERFLESFADLGSGVGDDWQLETPSPLEPADLCRVPLPAGVLREARKARLMILPNLLTELPPRATPELPAAFLANLAELGAALPDDAAILVIDRGKAPGAPPRAERVLELLTRSRPGARTDGIRQTQGRCTCRIARSIQHLYGRVKLETTRHQDQPLLDLHTLWGLVRYPGDRVRDGVGPGPD